MPQLSTLDKGSSDGSSEKSIDSLLGADLQTPGNGTTDVEEDTSVADADVATEQEPVTEGVEQEAGEESEDESSQGGSAEEGESDLELSESDTDFSEAAYARAAEHYSKRAGRTFDPKDPGDRWTLRELMQRGQKIKALQSEEAEAGEETEESGVGKTEEAKPAEPPPKPTPEQIRARVKEAREYAKANIVPEVAQEFADGFVKALWPGKEVKISPEQAAALAEVFSTFAVMQIADAIPSIIGAVPNAVKADPIFGRVYDMGTRESAIDEVLSVTNKAGESAYPDFEKLVDSGAIKKMLNSDDLKDAVFSRDPHKNLVAKLKFAYRLAKNQPVDLGALEKAAEAGRTQEKERAKKVGAGKLPPGSSRGSFTTPRRAGNFITTMVASSGSKFSKALAASKK